MELPPEQSTALMLLNFSPNAGLLFSSPIEIYCFLSCCDLDFSSAFSYLLQC